MKLKNPEFMSTSHWLLLRTHYMGGKLESEASADGAYVTFDTHRTPDGGIAIAPHGRLRISPSGDRHPDWRSEASSRFGVGCDLATEFAGMLYCPHTGKAIPVSRIEDNPVLWVDWEHAVALKAGGVCYETPEAKPTHAEPQQIKYSFANQKAVKALLARAQPIWAEAKLRVSLGDPVQGYRAETILKALVAEPAVTDFSALCAAVSPHAIGYRDSVPDELMHMARIAHGMVDLDPWRQAFWMDRVKLAAADRYESPYLEIRK